MGEQGMEGAIGWDILGIVGSLFGLFLIVSLAALVLFAALRIFSARQVGGRASSAENILRERFARSEISAEEYEQSMKVLRENPPHKNYEDYVRDAMNRLRIGRSENS